MEGGPGRVRSQEHGSEASGQRKRPEARAGGPAGTMAVSTGAGGRGSTHGCPGSPEVTPHVDFPLGSRVPGTQDQGPSGHRRLREQPSAGPVTRPKIKAPFYSIKNLVSASKTMSITYNLNNSKSTQIRRRRLLLKKSNSGKDRKEKINVNSSNGSPDQTATKPSGQLAASSSPALTAGGPCRPPA